MSWSANGTATAHPKSGGGGIDVRLDFPTFQQQSGHGAAESQMAFEAAKNAARWLLESGRFGTGNFTVNLSGHANPDNKPSAGWANDSVGISVVQAG